MDKGAHVAVWLHDEGARQFLGAPQASRVSRWVARGLVEAMEAPVGFWLAVDSVQESRADGKKVDWSAIAPRCLIRWESVITIQALAEKTSEIGFALKPAGGAVARPENGSPAGADTTRPAAV